MNKHTAASAHCKFCGKYSRKSNLKRHIESQHVFCLNCGNYGSLKKHRCFKQNFLKNNLEQYKLEKQEDGYIEFKGE